MLTLTLSGCRAAPAPQRDLTAPVVQVSRPPDSTPPALAENDLVRTIRVQLDKSISEEPSLKNRDIIFSVDDGDVTVTGNVRSDAEREKTNEIAMNVPGVRSVANALRISP